MPHNARCPSSNVLQLFGGLYGKGAKSRKPSARSPRAERAGRVVSRGPAPVARMAVQMSLVSGSGLMFVGGWGAGDGVWWGDTGGCVPVVGRTFSTCGPGGLVVAMAVVAALVAAMVATAAVSGCGPLCFSLKAPDPWMLGAACALRLCPRP